MEMLKKIWPFSFGEKKDIAGLIINIVIQLVLGIVIGFVISILADIKIIGIIFGLVGGLIDLYLLVGIVLSCLDYFKVLK